MEEKVTLKVVDLTLISPIWNWPFPLNQKVMENNIKGFSKLFIFKQECPELPEKKLKLTYMYSLIKLLIICRKGEKLQTKLL